MSDRKDIPHRYHHGWLKELDQRTSISKEMQDRYRQLTHDLGGLDRLSYQQRSLCERALWLEFWISTQERELASGGDIEVGKLTQATNSLQGLYSKLGLSRSIKEVNLADLVNV